MFFSAGDPLSAIIILVVAIVFVLVGVFFISLWYQDVCKARTTRSWPFVTGKVLKSHVLAERRRDKINNKNVTMHTPEVVYEYTVGDLTYQGSRISIGDTYWTEARDEPERKIASYPVDASVQVYYDATDPRYAVLEHGVSTGIMLFVLGAVILIITVLVAFVPLDSVFKLFQPR